MNAPDVATPAVILPHSPRAIRSVWLALAAWALCAGLHSGIRGLLHRKHKKWLGSVGIVLALQGVGALLLLGFSVETAIFMLVLWSIARFLLALIFTMFP